MHKIFSNPFTDYPVLQKLTARAGSPEFYPQSGIDSRYDFPLMSRDWIGEKCHVTKQILMFNDTSRTLLIPNFSFLYK